MDDVLSPINRPNLMQIVGSSCTGKTILATAIAIGSASHQRKVIYIDVDLSFSKSVLKSCNLGENVGYLQVVRIFTLPKLINFFEFIVQNESYHGSILILDSIDHILFTNFHCHYTHGWRVFHMRQLRTVAHFSAIVKMLVYRANLLFIYTKLPPNECKYHIDDDMQCNWTMSLGHPMYDKRRLVTLTKHDLLQDDQSKRGTIKLENFFIPQK